MDVPAATTTTSPPPLVDGIAFVGDSLAEDLGKGLAGHPQRRSLKIFNDGISGCGVVRSGPFRLAGSRKPLSPTCAAWSQTWNERLRRDRPKVVAIQVGRHEVLDRMHGGRWSNILEASYAAYVRSELEQAVALARAEGAKVVLLTAPAFQRPERSGGGQWPENDPARVVAFNRILRDLAAADPALTLIDLGERVSPGGSYADVVDGIKVRSDGVHFSPAGVAWIGSWLLPQLAALVGP